MIVKFLRQYNTTIAWATHGGKLSRNITPLEGEPIVVTNNDLQRIIKERGIQNVFYSGYATNVCVLMRPTGILKNFGVPYTVYIIRDNTLAIEMDETVENELVKEATIWNLELWHYKTTTIDDIERACVNESIEERACVNESIDTKNNIIDIFLNLNKKYCELF